MDKFYVGCTESIIENMDGQIIEEDLHKDTRLIIAGDNYTVFTTEEYLKEVQFNYSVEYTKTIEEWACEDNYSFYDNYVDGEIEEYSFTNYKETNMLFACTLQNMPIEELKNCDIKSVYIKCAKKLVIENLRKAANRLEKEIQ